MTTLRYNPQTRHVEKKLLMPEGQGEEWVGVYQGSETQALYALLAHYDDALADLERVARSHCGWHECESEALRQAADRAAEALREGRGGDCDNENDGF